MSTKTACRSVRHAVLLLLTSRAASVFSDLTKLQKLLVGDLLYELFEAGGTTDIVTLDAGVITTTTNARDDPCALYPLLETTNNVGAALVVVFIDLYVGCHKCARAYHFVSGTARART